MMNAILYAAGRAMRLGKCGRRCPKILLEFGGRSLLERHVACLASLGIRRLFVVTGYMREQIEGAFPEISSRYGLEIQGLFNADFTEGSALSMHVSLPAIEEGKQSVLLMDGDVLYDAHILERVVRSAHPSALVVDRGYSTIDDDPVLVPMRDGKPFEFVKKWQGEADSVGESVGFFKVDAGHISMLVRETRARSVGAGRRESYDEILRALVTAGCFGAEDITGRPWTEIDFPGDIAYAESVILPALGENRLQPIGAKRGKRLGMI
jgi:choline kinase